LFAGPSIWLEIKYMMKHLLTIILFAFSLTWSTAQTTQYFNSDGVAIRGYDPVAYFTENKPVEGSKQFSYSWQGSQWHFNSQENLNLFKANPDKYAPQFGGYCAYGVSEDHKSPTEANAFTIVNDKLYLNYNLEVKQLWMKDVKARIEKAEVNWKAMQFNLEDGLAIKGYDPVAYFVQHKAVEGKKEYAYVKEGVTYYFSSVSNKEMFVKNPSSYEPQYGGWCAYAMGATGEKVEVDPETFKVIDNKLYLFYNSLFNNTLPKWNQNEAGLKMKADKNWKGIYK
jgi:YHS domain-containing protein